MVEDDSAKVARGRACYPTRSIASTLCCERHRMNMVTLYIDETTFAELLCTAFKSAGFTYRWPLLSEVYDRHELPIHVTTVVRVI